VEGLQDVVKSNQGITWLDLREEAVDQCERLLRDVFQFHPLAIDDALVEEHVPKLDDWGEYTYVVLQAVKLTGQPEKIIKTKELDLFVGQNYLVSYQAEAIPAIDHLWEIAQRDERLLKKGIAYLVYQIADELVGDVFPITDELGARLDVLEDEILLEPRSDAIESILQLKRAAFELRRVILPQREVLNKLSRGDSSSIPFEQRMYFRDVYDHLVHLQDIVDGLRDMTGSVLEIHLSVVNNRMNEVMKVLTVITTLFMPITFITGFFGMNFFVPDVSFSAWSGQGVFWVTMLLLVCSPLVMWAWMRSRKWM
jgi:magnesium transporter